MVLRRCFSTGKKKKIAKRLINEGFSLNRKIAKREICFTSLTCFSEGDHGIKTEVQNMSCRQQNPVSKSCGNPVHMSSLFRFATLPSDQRSDVAEDETCSKKTVALARCFPVNNPIVHPKVPRTQNTAILTVHNRTHNHL
jgi:hypothetical protein